MGLAVEDAVALLDRGQSDRLREMTLAGAGRAEKEHVFASFDEARGRELEDELTVHLLVEVEVEAVEGLAVVAKAGLLDAAREQAILAAQQLVADERGEEVDVGLALGRRRLGCRISRTSAMPERRSLRSARSISTRFTESLLGSCDSTRSRYSRELADQRIDLAKTDRRRRVALEVASSRRDTSARRRRARSARHARRRATPCFFARPQRPSMRRTPSSPCSA